MKTTAPLVIYHASGLDGWLSAYAAWLSFGSNAEYLPAHYGDKPPRCDGRPVFILDFSYPKETLLRMATEAAQITILDHHKTAREDLESILGSHPKINGEFDMDRSGAVMAWQHFRGEGPVPTAVACAQDRDMWLFKRDDTKAITAYLMSFAFDDLPFWDEIVRRLDTTDGRTDALRQGSACLRQHQQLCTSIIESAGVIDRSISGHVVPTVNAPPQFASEIGHRLSEDTPFAAVWWESPAGFHYSLRSRKDGVDVSRIAKLHNGGGHANAAGFSTKFNMDSYRPKYYG